MRPVASVADQRLRARRRLPRPVFDFVDGGAEAEVTLAANRSALAALTFDQPCAVVPPTRDLTVDVLGSRLTMPVLIAPCGAARIVHPDGERALARAAAAGIAYVFPHVAGHRLQDVAGPSAGLWYQLYFIGERSWCEAALQQAWQAGCRVLILTTDGGARGLNERNVRNGLVPLLAGAPREVVPFVPQLLAHPGWSWRFARDRGRFRVPNIGADRVISQRDMVAGRVHGRGLAWSDLPWIRKQWPGKIVIKGVLRGTDARRAADEGAAGVIVSNHGGRQLDGAIASLHALEEVVTSAGDRLEVLFDGGVERGGDVVKAMCLGARAVLVGRATLWGLAIGGEDGVTQTLELLRDGIDRTLGLLGCTRPSELHRGQVRPPAF